MRVVFLGAGNLATHLSQALQQAGHDIVQVYSRTMQSAQRLAGILHTEATDDVASVKPDAQLYVISVKDDAIAPLASRLIVQRDDAIVVHTAGSVPMSVLAGSARHYGVIYPMQSFSRTRAIEWAHVPFYIEGADTFVEDALCRLTSDVSDRVRFLSSADRRYLHLAAVFACNFTNYCYTLAGRVMNSCGLSFDDLLPLIDETASKVHQLSPFEAQTGPAVRYDRQVIDRQLMLLDDMPEAKLLYKVASQGIHCLHEASTTDNEPMNMMNENDDKL